MFHSVPLKQPPTDFQPPDALSDRFWYDDARRQLCFDGFMSKATFDRLERLSCQGDYQLAINELFRICVPEANRQESWTARLGVIIGTGAGLVAAGLAGWLLLMR